MDGSICPNKCIIYSIRVCRNTDISIGKYVNAGMCVRVLVCVRARTCMRRRGVYASMCDEVSLCACVFVVRVHMRRYICVHAVSCVRVCMYVCVNKRCFHSFILTILIKKLKTSYP